MTKRFARAPSRPARHVGRVRAGRVRARRRLRQPRPARRQRGPLRVLGRAPERQAQPHRVREPAPTSRGRRTSYYTLPVAEGLRRDARALPGIRRDDDQLRGADRARRQARRRGRHRPRAARPRRAHQAGQGARLRLRVRGRRTPACSSPFPKQKGWTGKKTLARSPSRARQGLEASRAQAGAGHIETVDPVTGKPAVLFYAPVKTGRLELRRGRAEGRDPRRRPPPAHDADPGRPARAAG